ncbi:hypothetical protein SELMODRAFT_115557 [Selaginella moellendorffii]|uniref:Uncharacterized protein n=1 Tax=Selaginella moellendorffii TaxID=88036 RepID=D8SEX0_SELML|nr:outer envelope pore protein 24A, chloroplastic [Selaginella moellendorffii]EFJ17052.1 hypothetical protein SELMODRAFT_115557 [Selaginella moellendorffii]|eukprot:XP_002981959.1 outer envelope pore protein 24A, chloroplastic [Selaginella moellendorffii]
MAWGKAASSGTDTSDGGGGGIRFPRACFKTRIDAASRSAVGVLTVEAGDLLLRASCTDDTFASGPSLDGLSLGVEKPGSFLFDYDLGSRSPKFHFSSTANVMGSRTLNLCYTHHQSDPSSTAVEAALTLDPKNKLGLSYDFASQAGRARYSFVHDRSGACLEPAFHLGTKTWDFGVSRKVSKEDSIKATYKGLDKSIVVDWSRASKDGTGPFKIYADIPLARESSKPPKLMMEKTWSY